MGLYFGRPVSENVIFPALLFTLIIPYSLFWIYFTLLLPIFSLFLPLSYFPSPFFLSLPYLLFSLIFATFFLSLSIFFPQMTAADIPPGVFSNI
jgi:hypothetical protein